MPQLFVQSVLVRLKVADLLAINLILLALLLDLLRLPIELLLLNAVLVELLLQRIILANYRIVLIVKFVLFLLEVSVLPYNLFHRILDSLELESQFSLLLLTLDLEVLVIFFDLLLLDIQLIHLASVGLILSLNLAYNSLVIGPHLSCLDFGLDDFIPDEPDILQMLHLDLVQVSSDLRFLPLVVQTSLSLSRLDLFGLLFQFPSSLLDFKLSLCHRSLLLGHLLLPPQDVFLSPPKLSLVGSAYLVYERVDVAA